MDRTQFKQRIVGAIVLVALGVIFIPIILNQEGDDSPISESNIPEKPEVLQELASQQPPAPPAGPDIDTDKPRLVDEDTPLVPPIAPIEQTDSTVSDKKPATNPPEQAVPVKPVETVKTKPQETKATSEAAKPASEARAWVVQVASFSERSKALKLRDRLRKAKYAAFVESVNSTKGTLYRVRVGPVVKREKADVLKKKIIKEFKIKDALVMAHP